MKPKPFSVWKEVVVCDDPHIAFLQKLDWFKTDQSEQSKLSQSEPTKLDHSEKWKNDKCKLLSFAEACRKFKKDIKRKEAEKKCMCDSKEKVGIRNEKIYDGTISSTLDKTSANHRMVLKRRRENRASFTKSDKNAQKSSIYNLHSGIEFKRISNKAGSALPNLDHDSKTECNWSQSDDTRCSLPEFREEKQPEKYNQSSHDVSLKGLSQSSETCDIGLGQESRSRSATSLPSSNTFRYQNHTTETFKSLDEHTRIKPLPKAWMGLIAEESQRNYRHFQRRSEAQKVRAFRKSLYNFSAKKKKKSKTAVVEVQETGHLHLDDDKQHEAVQSAVPTLGVKEDQVSSSLRHSPVNQEGFIQFLAFVIHVDI